MIGRFILLAALLLAAEERAFAARPQLVAAFDDAAADATGPGSYTRPGDSELTDGDFDLRRFEVWLDGDEVAFKVTMGASFRQPGVTARTNVTPLPLWNNIYFQNIDIYVDTDRASPAGYAVCVPGRRVRFTEGRTWKVAVVLTPQPGPARGVTEDALGEVAKHVLFPKNLQAHGRTVTARVPVSAFGGPPNKSWGYSVHVSGARWERSFSVADRVFRDKPQPDAFTMPVVGVAEAWAFGGAPDGAGYPFVVDVLLPRGANQAAILGSYDAKTGDYARVPFVELEPGPPAKVAAAVPATTDPRSPAALTVVDLSETTVTVGGAATGIKPMMIGQVVDAHGDTVARIVVIRVLKSGLVADVVDGADKIKRGAAVRFTLKD
jgi:carbohydrate-binding DOMON domain-containing protein